MTERDTTRPEDPREGPDPNRYDGLGFDEDWSSRYGGAPPPRPRQGSTSPAVFVLLDALRRAAPPELQERVSALIREVLLTLRSLIDWYLNRLDNPPREPRVEDIPID